MQWPRLWSRCRYCSGPGSASTGEQCGNQLARRGDGNRPTVSIGGVLHDGCTLVYCEGGMRAAATALLTAMRHGRRALSLTLAAPLPLASQEKPRFARVMIVS